MARPVKFAHVVYMTRRYEAMIAWYRDVFEAEIVNMVHNGDVTGVTVNGRFWTDALRENFSSTWIRPSPS